MATLGTWSSLRKTQDPEWLHTTALELLAACSRPLFLRFGRGPCHALPLHSICGLTRRGRRRGTSLQPLYAPTPSCHFVRWQLALSECAGAPIAAVLRNSECVRCCAIRVRGRAEVTRGIRRDVTRSPIMRSEERHPM